MAEFLQPGHNQNAALPVAAETARTLPVRVFLFEPHAVFRETLQELLSPVARVTAFATMDDAMRGIEDAYQKDPNPFDRVLIAPGASDDNVLFPAERIIYILKQRGMDPSVIALHSSRELGDVAERNGVAFLYKGDSKAVSDFLSNTPPRK